MTPPSSHRNKNAPLYPSSLPNRNLKPSSQESPPRADPGSSVTEYASSASAIRPAICDDSPSEHISLVFGPCGPCWVRHLCSPHRAEGIQPCSVLSFSSFWSYFSSALFPLGATAVNGVIIPAGGLGLVLVIILVLAMLGYLPLWS